MTREKFLANSIWLPPFGRMVVLLLLCLVFQHCSGQAASQDSTVAPYQPLFAIGHPATNFTTDKLGNIYILAPGNVVIKFGPDGRELFRYYNKTLGEAAYLDATNPFNLLLYFPNHATVVALDRTMNMLGQINLQQFGLLQINAVGMAADSRVWVYDEINFRLKKIDFDGSVVVEGADMSLVLGKTIQPNFLVERDQLVYLNDPALGILVFDAFGQYQKTLPILGLSYFQVFDDQLLYFLNGTLFSFHVDVLREKTIQLPAGVEASKVQVQKDRLYLLSKEGVVAFHF